MTTEQMERRARILKEKYEKLDEASSQLWMTAETEEEVERYNEIAMRCNDALDDWLEAEAALFERWDLDNLNPKGAK